MLVSFENTLYVITKYCSYIPFSACSIQVLLVLMEEMLMEAYKWWKKLLGLTIQMLIELKPANSVHLQEASNIYAH